MPDLPDGTLLQFGSGSAPRGRPRRNDPAAVLKIERVKARDLQSYRGRRLLLIDDSGNTLACPWQDFRLDESAPQPGVTVHIIEWQRWFDGPDYYLDADAPVEVLLDG